MPKKPAKVHSWRIFRIKGTPAAEIGTVEAPDAETAIKVAIKEFNITNSEQQKWLMAQRRA
jgi:1,2-phenylacetyl-CoA epoxidase PaaB subunit